MKIFPILSVLTLSFAMLANASAVTALIDFGIATQVAPSPYNSVSYAANGNGVTTGAVALNDTTAAATGWTISVTETGSGNGGNAGGGANVPAPYPTAVTSFDVNALQDSLFANQGGGTNPAMVVNIAGLDSSATYDLLFYGSRNNAQNADQRWSLTQGTGGADVDHGSELNATVAVDWPSISPNGSGIIEITINSPGPDNIGALALNFGSITQVPEPSAALLFVLGGIGFVARRRR